MLHSVAGKSIVLFLAGAAIGAGAALLTAPMAGRDVRRKLKQVSGDLVQRASRVAPAIRKASVAGKEAFVQSLNGSELKPGTIGSLHH